MRDVYKYETLGEWIVLHKANADKILRKDGFMVALRYDIRIRANAFAHRVVKNGVKSFSDISIFRQEVYDTAYAEARRNDEFIFREVNPYAVGGVQGGQPLRSRWSPCLMGPTHWHEIDHKVNNKRAGDQSPHQEREPTSSVRVPRTEPPPEQTTRESTRRWLPGEKLQPQSLKWATPHQWAIPQR
jgi:sRNA-binding carbon storage regulator CsrA